MKLKLHRDKVISIVKGKDLVGVYVKTNVNMIGDDEDDIVVPKGTEILLAEMHPKKADAIIKLWNK
jgi:uncharacterized secreted protein with C-terminal beta-propeller domain